MTVGLRLASGSVGFEVALTVLLLAPEAYWPLRRVGAEFHAAAEGTAALADADDLLARAGTRGAGTALPTSTGLVLSGLEIGHAPGPALTRPLDLELPDRGLVAIAGPSGSGKSTLLATLRGGCGRWPGTSASAARRSTTSTRGGGAAWSAGRPSGRGCWPTRSLPTSGSLAPRPATTRCGRRCAASASTTSSAPSPGSRHAAR
ncbi:hypothetical protein ACNKF0_10125 [Nocardioides sp. T5]|uniref:hypothetical protein n=1 Tax=Nocardioides sp. T5 TaxID=3400182 RepID=UPI003A8BB38F